MSAAKRTPYKEPQHVVMQTSWWSRHEEGSNEKADMLLAQLVLAEMPFACGLDTSNGPAYHEIVQNSGMRFAGTFPNFMDLNART